jgi:hypothetical protein
MHQVSTYLLEVVKKSKSCKNKIIIFRFCRKVSKTSEVKTKKIFVFKKTSKKKKKKNFFLKKPLKKIKKKKKKKKKNAPAAHADRESQRGLEAIVARGAAAGAAGLNEPLGIAFF